MRKLFLSFISIALLCVACTEGPDSITLNKSMLTMQPGDVAQLEATAAGEVAWSSDNDSVATVYEGFVRAIGVGNATITASIKGGKATCMVYVKGKSGETLRISPANVLKEKGETYQYYYASSYDVPLTWSSSNPEVATVDENGLVTALRPGHTDISLSNGIESVKSNFCVAHHWGEYQLVWSDEFNGSSLDLNTWNVEVNGNGGGNNEKQYYTSNPENLRVEDGNLIIQLRKEEYQNKHYTSGRINSREKRFFKYGKIEARICFPAGGGTWPAFWMMGNDYKQVGWPKCGEIDIIEHVGNNPTMLSYALHTPERNGMSGTNWSARHYDNSVENNYHVYGIEWVEEANYGCDIINFTYDGEVCASKQEDINHLDENHFWPFNKEHFIIFNLAIGGNMGGNINDAIFDNDAQIMMKVDWVRVYQHQEVE